MSPEGLSLIPEKNSQTVVELSGASEELLGEKVHSRDGRVGRSRETCAPQSLTVVN